MTPDTETVAEYDEDGFVQGYVCPHCRSPVKLDHVDDVGTKWFKCDHCRQQSCRLKTPQRHRLDGALAYQDDVQRPCTLEAVAKILDSTIKRDTTNKVITFITMLLTYTDEDQINISYTAEPATGKSYIPLELVWYFPAGDVVEYTYVSPQAFFHEYGTLLPDPTDTRDVDPEKRRKIKYIDLRRKILVFIDQPHDLLLQRLRPLLSHDRKTLVSKITDQRKTVGLVTKTVVIEGYPTVLFCTARFSMEDQERTRLLLLSPDTTQSKLKDAILLRIEKEGDRHAFKKFMESDEKRMWLKDRVDAIATSNVKNVVIPDALRRQIADRFFTMHPALLPRHQRDIGRVLALIKACAMLNLWHRERRDDTIVANDDDVTHGLQLYGQVSAANELGLPPEVFNVYAQLKPRILDAGVTRKDFQALYFQAFHRTIGKRRLGEMLDLLSSVGLLTEEPDPVDKRQKRILLLGHGTCDSETPGQSAITADGEINTPRGRSNFDPALRTPSTLSDYPPGDSPTLLGRGIFNSQPETSDADAPGAGQKAQQAPQDGGDRVSLTDLVAVHWAAMPSSEQTCGVCGSRRVTRWQAETNRKTAIPICEACVRAFETQRADAT